MYLKYQLVRDRDCFQRQVSSDNRISLEILVLDKLASAADPHHLHPHTHNSSHCGQVHPLQEACPMWTRGKC